MSDGEWIDYGPGVRVRRLGTEGGAGFYLVRMDAGAVQARHAHPQRETATVLEGAVIVDTWPESDPHGRRHSDAFGCVDSDSDPCARARPVVDVYSGLSHALRAHPKRGALLLTVARPDWAPTS